MQAALPLRLGKRGSRRRQLVSSLLAAVAVEGSPRLHPTTKLPIPAVNTIHTFSAKSKLCFVRDRLSGKDFLVDTGATLSLLPYQSATAATGPKLQSVLRFFGMQVNPSSSEAWSPPPLSALRKAAPSAAVAEMPPMCVFWHVNP
jgi:hypothetical protein